MGTTKSQFDVDSTVDIAWCPGCGDFPIRQALLGALDELCIERDQLVMVSGIGQAAKMPQYINASFFNGLHGRGLPPATAIKAVNPGLTVIAEGGDGDMYGDIFQPCVSFNKLNTFQWFKANTYYLPPDWDASNRTAAFAKALEEMPFPLGVLYESDHRPTFEENQELYRRSSRPLVGREHDLAKLRELIAGKH